MNLSRWWGHSQGVHNSWCVDKLVKISYIFCSLSKTAVPLPQNSDFVVGCANLFIHRNVHSFSTHENVNVSTTRLCMHWVTVNGWNKYLICISLYNLFVVVVAVINWTDRHYSVCFTFGLLLWFLILVESCLILYIIVYRNMCVCVQILYHTVIIRKFSARLFLFLLYFSFVLHNFTWCTNYFVFFSVSFSSVYSCDSLFYR